MVLLEEGQSRRMVEVGPTREVVVMEVVGVAEVGVGVVEEEEESSMALDDCELDWGDGVVLEFEEREDSAPPTPPPTAAAITMIAMIIAIQNVRFLKPQIVFVRDCSGASLCHASLCVSDAMFGCAGIGSGE